MVRRRDVFIGFGMAIYDMLEVFTMTDVQSLVHSVIALAEGRECEFRMQMDQLAGDHDHLRFCSYV